MKITYIHLLNLYVAGVLCLCLVQAGETYQIEQFQRSCDSGICKGPMEHCRKALAPNRMATCRSCDIHCGKLKRDIPQGCHLHCALVNEEVIPAAEHKKILQNTSEELMNSMHSQCNEDMKKSLKEFADEKDQDLNYKLSKAREKLSDHKNRLCNEASRNKTSEDINKLRKDLFIWQCYGTIASVVFPLMIIAVIMLFYRTKITACNMCSRRKPKQKKEVNKRRIYEESGTGETTITSGSSKPLIVNTENNHTNVDNREDKKALALSNGTTEH